MNEMLDSQLSAMFDDELPSAECELLARRLSKDEALQARWRHYAIIGAAVRGERGLALSVDVTARVRKAVAAEAVLSGQEVAADAGRNRISRRLWQGAAGVGLAAGVAALSVFWLRSQIPAGETLVARNTAPAVVASAEPEGADRYVVPTTVESNSVVATAELANYVVAHSEFSAPLSRRNLLSSLVATESGTLRADGESEEGAVIEPQPAETTDTPDAQDPK